MFTRAIRLPGIQILRNRPLMSLALGHMTIDMYVGLIPMLYPMLIHQFDLDLKTVGLVSLVYSTASSLAQPFFGWVADRFGTRLIGLALIWTASTFALLGLAPTFSALLVLAGIAGLGSAAYHPLGAVNADAVITGTQRNAAMSVYVTGGSVGVALAPILGAIIFPLLGLPGTLLMIFPGAAVALWLVLEFRPHDSRHWSVAGQGKAKRKRTPLPWLALSVIILVMMARTWTFVSIEVFVPTWYDSLGYEPAFYGAMVTVIVLSSAVSTVLVGALADRFGQRRVIVGTLIVTIPAILLFAAFPGPVAFLSGALLGAAGASTNPILLTMAQRLMVGRAGIASGLILGLGFVTGALGVPVMGALADSFGFQPAIQVQALLVVATIPLALLLPEKRAAAQDTAA